MEQTYITIGHLDEFHSMELVKPGMNLILRKEQNAFDDECIGVYSENGAKYGYVSNSTNTVARGTHSAGYIYRDFQEKTECTVMFQFDCIAIGVMNRNSAE